MSASSLPPARRVHAALLLALAAVVRVAAPLLVPTLKPQAIALAGALWAISLLLYLVKYTPFLTRARVDGREG